MKRTLGTLGIALTVGLAMIAATVQTARADVNIDARIEITPRPNDDLRIWIWPDRGEGATYFPGEEIRINVEANRGCFLILYDVDTRGNLRILFPYDPWDDNYVRGGEVITFPRGWDGYTWTVDGPVGIEYVQAIASEFPISPPDWPIYIRSVNHGGAICHDPELRDFRAGNNRLDYIDVVNHKITGRYWNYTATDLASFYVHPRYNRPVVVYDPWPDVFYGEIYIGWPVGGRIYIDGIYVGIAPLWIPRSHGYGHHTIICKMGEREVRRQSIDFRTKKDYRYKYAPYGEKDVISHGSAKPARRGGVEVYEKETGRVSKDTRTPSGKVIVPDRGRETEVKVDRSRTVEREKTVTRERQDNQRTVTVEKSTKRTVKVDEQKTKPESNKRSWLGSVVSGIGKAVSKGETKTTTRVEKSSSGGKQEVSASKSAQKSESKKESVTRERSTESAKTVKRAGGRVK